MPGTPRRRTKSRAHSCAPREASNRSAPSPSPGIGGAIRTLVGGLESSRDVAARRLDSVYRDQCAALGVKPAPLALTDKEREYARMIPRRRFKVYSEEAQQQGRGGRGAPAPQALREFLQPKPLREQRRRGSRASATPPSTISSTGREASWISTTQSVRMREPAGRQHRIQVRLRARAGIPGRGSEAVANAIRNLERSGVVEITTLISIREHV